MLRYIVPVIFLCVTLAQAMETNIPIELDQVALNKLRDVLIDERKESGTFIKKIIHDLKECINGKMIELSFLTVKSSYWWDKIPNGSQDSQGCESTLKRVLSIDRKFRSSVYDREKHAVSETIRSYFCKNTGNLNIDDCINSWESVREKVKFFENKDIPSNTIPDTLKEIMGHGLSPNKHLDTYPSINKHLDTYPSIFQMIRALKTLKYETKELKKCSLSSPEIEEKHPSDVVSEGIIKLFSTEHYQRFVQQNHPLCKIIQDHLNKLKYKAEQKHFKPNTVSAEYQKPILYDKILQQMDYLVQLMSVFNINMDTEKCDIPGSDKWGSEKPLFSYYLYAQLYEVFNDLLFLLMSVDNLYTSQDFDKFLTNAYINRFPVFKKLSENKDILMASYPMRSGMDAFVNASMAIGHAPQDIFIAPKVADLQNTVYYEISKLLEFYPNRGDMKSAVFLSKEPSSEEKDAIDDAILWAYVDTQVDASLDNTGDSIDFDDYIEKLINSFENNIFLNENYKINMNLEQKNSNEKRVSQCKKIITEAVDQYPKLNNMPEKNFFLSIFKERLDQLDQLPKNEEKSNFYVLKDTMKSLTEALFRILPAVLKLKFNLLEIYLKKQYQGDAKEVFHAKVKELLNTKDMFPLQESSLPKGEGEFYVEVPLFMNRYNFPLKLKDLFPDLVDNMFTVDKHHSLTSGMTTDTIDPSGDKTYIDKLHRKINQIRILKQDWNSSTDPFIILWDTTMEIDQGPCYALMDKFQQEIESGNVVIVLFKSLQKYANLGIGKSRAGVVTLVGKNVPAVVGMHEKLTAYGKDVFSHSQEYALMTFFYESFQEDHQDNEKLYYQAVRNHAPKIRSKSVGLYPMMISGGCLFTNESKCKESVPYSDTFGFAIPTATSIENGLCRYSVGLDPKGGLNGFFKEPSSSTL